MLTISKLKENLMYIAVFLSLMPVLRPFSINITYSDVLFVILILLLFFNKNISININIFGNNNINFLYFFSVVIFFLGFGISDILNNGQLDFFLISGQYFLLLVLLPILFANININKRKLIITFITSIVTVVLFGIYLYFFSSTSGYSIGGRMGSLFVNPNTLAKTISTSIPVLLLFAYYYKKNIVFLWLFVLLIGLLISSSFGGITASIISLILFYILSMKFKDLLKIVLVICSILTIYISYFGLPDIFTNRIIPVLLTGDIDEAGSFTIKTLLMKESLEVISENPFLGTGLGRYSDESVSNMLVHNTYLLIWAEGGLLSLLGLMGILLSFVFKAFSYKKNRLIYATSLTIIFVLCFNFLTNVHFYNRYTFMSLYCVIFGFMINKNIISKVNDNENNHSDS